MNDGLGPLGTTFNLLRRVPGLFEIFWRNEPGIDGFVLWGSETLDQAYNAMTGSGVSGAITQLFQVRNNDYYRSTTPRRRGWGIWGAKNHNQTHAMFAIEDFTTPSNTVPLDGRIVFLRTQVLMQNGSGVSTPLVVAGATNTGNPVLGPTYIIPAASFFGHPNVALQIYGTAPTGTTCTAGAPPVFDLSMQAPLPLHLFFPRMSDEGFLTNKHAEDDLLFSFDPGLPMSRVKAGETHQIKGHFKQLILAAGDTEAVPFDLTFSMDNLTYE